MDPYTISMLINHKVHAAVNPNAAQWFWTSIFSLPCWSSRARMQLSLQNSMSINLVPLSKREIEKYKNEVWSKREKKTREHTWRFMFLDNVRDIGNSPVLDLCGHHADIGASSTFQCNAYIRSWQHWLNPFTVALNSRHISWSFAFLSSHIFGITFLYSLNWFPLCTYQSQVMGCCSNFLIWI